jgi:hypothetical protein
MFKKSRWRATTGLYLAPKMGLRCCTSIVANAKWPLLAVSAWCNDACLALMLHRCHKNKYTVTCVPLLTYGDNTFNMARIILSTNADLLRDVSFG